MPIQRQNAARTWRSARRIRETMAGDYDKASDKGISKKLLKRIIKEREHERKIFGLTDDLEPDERSDHEMLKDSCGYNGWIMSAVSQAIVVIQRL